MRNANYCQEVSMSPRHRLRALQTFQLDPVNVAVLGRHEGLLWSQAHEDLQKRYLNEVDPARSVVLETFLDRCEGALLYYAFLNDGQTPDGTSDEDRLMNLFADDALLSYATNLEQVQQVTTWCDEQRLTYAVDQVRLGIRNQRIYHRVLSKPALKTQTSQSGVVFQKDEIIDVPLRKMVTLAKAIERAESYL